MIFNLRSSRVAARARANRVPVVRSVAPQSLSRGSDHRARSVILWVPQNESTGAD